MDVRISFCSPVVDACNRNIYIYSVIFVDELLRFWVVCFVVVANPGFLSLVNPVYRPRHEQVMLI
jgi:hypothetical protein